MFVQRNVQYTIFLNECLYFINFVYLNRIDVSEGTGINKTSGSKECDICYY